VAAQPGGAVAEGDGAADGDADGDGDGDGDGGEAEEEEEEEEEEEGGDGDDDAVEDELADLERQLAELSALDEAEDEAAEGGRRRGQGVEEEEAVEFTVKPSTRHTVSKEEEDEFEKAMAAMTMPSSSSSSSSTATSSSAPLKSMSKPNMDHQQLARLSGLSAMLSRGTAVAGGGSGGGDDPAAAHGGNGGGGGGGGGGPTVALRVVRRGAKPTRLEADLVHVPVSDELAQTVIRMDEKESEERQRLKRYVLSAAEDHEHAPRGYIANIRQAPIEERGSAARSGGGGGSSTGLGNYNSNWRREF
jgi:hypothetical protein